MLDDIKTVLEQLNSALFTLKEEIKKAETKGKDAENTKIKLDILQTEYDQKLKDLNEREGKVKNIESIVEFSEKAKVLMQEAKALMTNAEYRQEKLEQDFKKLGEERVNLQKEKDDFNVMQTKQIQAFKKEKSEFEANVNIFNNALSMSSANIKNK